MIFFNNMQYDSEAIEPLQGAFYASTSYDKPIFNYFREEEDFDFDQLLQAENEEVEDLILKYYDLKFLSLRSELERLFKKKNLNEITQDEMKANIGSLRKIHEKALALNRENDRLRAKYSNDAKYARIHKRMSEKGSISQRQLQLFEALSGVKRVTDLRVLQSSRLLNNEDYFNKMTIHFVINRFKKEAGIPLDADATRDINNLISK
jgi:type I restriction enzyme R subunit